jgi:2,3-dihydro-2,3-dihydroxybenzoate dehydrogenase
VTGVPDAGLTVVVGAGQGIGAELARRLAAAEWTERMVIADVAGERVAAVAEGIQGAEARTLDVTDHAAVAAFAADTSEAERVAIAAGVFASGPALDVDAATFRRILDVNLMGNYFVAQAYARAMAERGSGSICALASIAARMPRMRQVAYCASKAGMRQALRVLGMEVAGRGVRVNTVSPGPTDTPMMRALAADHAVDDLAQGSHEAMRPRIPVGRVARPADVASAVEFLLSPAAGHVTLHDLVVDGGELLGM